MSAADLLRTWLFVPGSRPALFEKAESKGPDAIIIDLEDAVAESDKESSRAACSVWLANRDHLAFVRVNAADSQWYEGDIEVVESQAGLRGVMLPKARARDVLTLSRRSVPIVPLIESAEGLSECLEIAKIKNVVVLAFGSLDFALDISCAHVRDSLLFARSHLVFVSRLAGLFPPIDGVTVDITSPVAAKEDARYARELGFGGKLCVHPSQVEEVNLAFEPTQEEVKWAYQILNNAALSSGSAGAMDGEMVDAAVVRRATQIEAAHVQSRR